MTTFSDLGLNPAILAALAKEGYETPTPIQAQAIPGVLEGRDLLGIAQTGTGKTAAFAMPILHRLAANPKETDRGKVRALILSPTRELASQIADSFRAYGRGLGLTVGVIFGGVAHRPQIDLMRRGLDVLVATPGRLLDLMGEGHISLGGVEILVLDEADQMLDLGFIRPLRQIISRLPKDRQGLFFSATMPHEIGALAAELLRDPLRVAVTPVAKTADRVEQKVIHVETPRKRALLVELFGDPALSRTLVFTRTKRGADRVARHLEQSGIAVAAIHGNKSQNQRERALSDFKGGKIRGLVATEIAARGIDVDQVSHVINYEMPNIPESYVHRIGRTARAGSEGIAISFVDGEECAYLRDIERLIKQKIPSEDRRGCAELAKAAKAQDNAMPRENGRAGDRDEDERGARFARNGRGGGRGDRGHRGDRGAPRGERGGERGDRSPRQDRERPARAEFAPRGDRGDRGDRRPHQERSERGEAPRHAAPRGEHRRDETRRDEPRRDASPRSQAPRSHGSGNGDIGNVRFLQGANRGDSRHAHGDGRNSHGDGRNGHADRRPHGSGPAREAGASRDRNGGNAPRRRDGGNGQSHGGPARSGGPARNGQARNGQGRDQSRGRTH